MTQHLIIFYLTLLRKGDAIFKIVDLYCGCQDDRAGKRTQLTEPDKIATYSYDRKSQLTGAEVSKKGKSRFCKERLYDVRYTYDAVGNRIAMEVDTEHGQSLPFQSYAPTHDRQPQLKHPLRVEYAYNNANQLVAETAWRIEGKWRKKEKRAWETAYTFDANGNVMTKALTKKQGCERDEDEEAWEEECKCNNKCRKKEHKGCSRQTIYEYDYANLLSRITYPDGEINTFQNCRCGTFRLQKTDSQGLRNYLYDKENDSPIFECDENYNPLVKYIKGPRIDELISKKYLAENGQWKTVYYLYDGLGSVRQLVDEKGKVVAEYDYLPFGEIIEAKGTQARKNPFTYTGREYDRDSGLYYYRARYVDPRLGRFTSKDPLIDILIQNQAGYMNNGLGLSVSHSGCGNGCSSGGGNYTQPLGMWLSRDPIGEWGGVNLYMMCRNNPINRKDILGNIDIPFNPPFGEAVTMPFPFPVTFYGPGIRLQQFESIRQSYRVHERRHKWQAFPYSTLFGECAAYSDQLAFLNIRLGQIRNKLINKDNQCDLLTLSPENSPIMLENERGHIQNYINYTILPYIRRYCIW